MCPRLFLRCLCMAVTLTVRSPLQQQTMRRALSLILLEVRSLGAAPSRSLLPAAHARLRLSGSGFCMLAPSCDLRVCEKVTAEVAFAGSCRDGRFQVTGSQVGMNDCQVLKWVSFLCVQAEAHTCRLHSTKRFRLKVALRLTRHPSILRGPCSLALQCILPTGLWYRGASVGVLLISLTQAAE